MCIGRCGLLCLGLSLSVSLAGCAGGGPEGVRVGDPVPSFAVKTSTGEKLTSDSLGGQIVVLNFWSTSCRPCVGEIPELDKLERGARATVVGIALDERGWKTVQPFLERHKVSFRVALGDEDLFRRFDGTSIPYTLLLDRSMRVVKVYRRPVTREELEKDIGTIAEPVAKS